MTIDKQALREAAEKAGKDKWQAKKINGDFYVIRSGSYIKQCGITSYQPIAEIDHKPVRDFVAMVNPATTLALLDENLQLQREKDAIEAVALALRDDMRQAREQLAAAEQERENWRISFDNERYRADKLAAAFNAEHEQLVMANRSLITQHIRANSAESRIAELEAREVTLPQRLQPGADGYDDWYVHSADDGEYLKADDVIEAIRAAGIRVKES
ncbi:ead/Ea22-like family protein [Salmonella enterica]|nr:ead/Ea22-like family protein [Salmonella enterica]